MCHTLSCQRTAVHRRSHSFEDLRQTWLEVISLVPPDPRAGEPEGGHGKRRLNLPPMKTTPFLIQMPVQQIAVTD